MNTIGATIDRGEIEVDTISWETFNDIYVPICADCHFLGMAPLDSFADYFMNYNSRAVCVLFDSPYNSVEPRPASLMSLAPLMSVIVKCTLKEEQ